MLCLIWYLVSIWYFPGLEMCYACLCGIFVPSTERTGGAQVEGEAQTGGKFLRMKQLKARGWYFGGNWVLDFALGIDVSEPCLCLVQGRAAATFNTKIIAGMQFEFVK